MERKYFLNNGNGCIFVATSTLHNTFYDERDYNSNFHIYNTAGVGASCASVEVSKLSSFPSYFISPSKIFDK